MMRVVCSVSMNKHKTTPVTLKRNLGPITVTFYGLGTIIGAGIYVLLGSVAQYAGSSFPYAFLIAGIIAIFTALSYAELSARLPHCAGATVYVETAWQRRWLATTVGWMLVFTGVVSASAIANGFVGYLNEFFVISDFTAILGLVLLLGLIAALDMKSSAILVFAITVLELSGLGIVIYSAWQAEPAIATVAEQAAPDNLMIGVLLGSFVAFYAFIGFEDMVNIVEEVKRPSRNLPIAIIVAVLVATLLYYAVAVSALRVLNASELAQSDAPLSAIMAASGGSRQLIAIISLIAVVNGALVQIIMASRVLYGMAAKNMAPSWFGSINWRTRTPVHATVLVTAIILLFALLMPITRLAQLTSLAMLLIFILVNLALVKIKRQMNGEYEGIRFPVAVPILGAMTALVLLLFQLLPLLS